MKKQMKLISILLMVVLIITQIYTVSFAKVEVTEESYKKALESFVEEMTKKETEGGESGIEIQQDEEKSEIVAISGEEKYKYNYDFSSEFPQFISNIKITKDMTQEQCNEEIAKIAVPLMLGLVPTAQIQNPDLELDNIVFFTVISLIDYLAQFSETDSTNTVDIFVENFSKTNTYDGDIFTITTEPVEMTEEYNVKAVIQINTDKDFSIITDKIEDTEKDITDKAEDFIGGIITDKLPENNTNEIENPSTNEIQNPSTDERLPQTGLDMQIIYALEGVIVISIAFILFIVIKNRKEKK